VARKERPQVQIDVNGRMHKGSSRMLAWTQPWVRARPKDSNDVKFVFHLKAGKEKYFRTPCAVFWALENPNARCTPASREFCDHPRGLRGVQWLVMIQNLNEDKAESFFQAHRGDPPIWLGSRGPVRFRFTFEPAPVTLHRDKPKYTSIVTRSLALWTRYLEHVVVKKK
jgi:hypothetical protein